MTPSNGLVAPRAATARIVWPVAGILLSMLSLAVGGLIWTGQRTNELAVERQKMQLVGAIESRKRQALEDLARIAGAPATLEALRWPMNSANAQRQIGGALEEHFDFEASFVVTPEDFVVTGRVDGQPADQRAFAMRRPLLAGVLADVRDRVGQLALRRDGRLSAAASPEAVAAATGVSRILHDGVKTHIIVGVALPDEATAQGAFGGLIAVATRPLTAEGLRDGALMSGFDDLRIETGQSTSAASLYIVGLEGARQPRFAWTPDRPGDSVMEHVFPSILIAILAIGVFSAFMFAHVRFVTTDLVNREAQANHLAHHDPLSGLPNRVHFTKRLDSELSRIRESSESVAVLFLDLDRFKEVNDTFGHGAGDELIRQVARRLSDTLRGADMLSRFGGDEFAIIQTRVKGPSDSAALAQRVLDAVQAPFQVVGAEVTVGVSIGIALAPSNSREREQLMKLADLALYRAKSEGRNRYCFFELGMDDALRLRKAVEDDLRDAIARNELNIVYQPQFTADGRKVLGVEALVRWNHPIYGPIPPANFIPIAEERGLVGLLGEWVLRQACRDGRRWPGISVAVNVSPIQFRHPDFVETIARIVSEEEMEPGRVELELTEGVIVEDADAAETAMMELRARGFRFALDDFGTGYSSLIYLRRFAFDKIKIDRSFLESMESTGESAILVHSVVHLGRALGLTVTAEGVETLEQQRFLQAVGCHQLQGYLFCRPVPASEIDELLANPADMLRIRARAVA
ncbi:MAG: EAL domain-containing protein [Burkholderiales bacterium]|nr:EAL domain-containing protein [Burkholderiales bacterium]